MRIQSNATALNAYRNYNIHNNRIAQAMQRLSSGFRINSAADDPAGLAVSQRLKAKLTMLGTEKRNAMDSQSAIQVMDGSLSEVQSMLHRMNELANMAANGTYSDQDRAIMDREYQQLMEGINTIGASSTFNGIKLFGDHTSSSTLKEGISGTETQEMTVTLGDDLDSYLNQLDQLLLDISTAANAGDEEKLLSLGIDRSNGKSDKENLKSAILEFTKNNANRLTSPSQEETGGAQYTLNLSGQGISIKIASVSDKDLGLKNTNLLTQEDAKKAAAALKNAISNVSSQRGTIGAAYNRLDYTINGISNMEENLTSALSRILDADMAKEMMVLVKEKLLSQASMFAMAQANQQPDQVLSLLKSM